MSYHKVLGFQKEPFSTSPDPDFFYLSKEHEIALTNILIELRLRRGLSVILGDIGTGKTTLSRRLVQELKKRTDFTFHMILNPAFENEQQFLKSLIRNFNVDSVSRRDFDGSDLIGMRDKIEQFLIQKGIVEKKTVVLIIDEAQKLNEKALETLRVLLNFETNEFKLIQIVLLGQLELYPKISRMANFLDRISFKHMLKPLDQEDTKALIEFRISRAKNVLSHRLFLDEAIEVVHDYTNGYPRRINMLCHQILKELVMQNELVVDKFFVQEVISREHQYKSLELHETLPVGSAPRWSCGQSAIG